MKTTIILFIKNVKLHYLLAEFTAASEHLTCSGYGFWFSDFQSVNYSAWLLLVLSQWLSSVVLALLPGE